MKILFIYQFCSFGGVERVILNRVEAWKESARPIKVDIAYLSDAGGFGSFKRYIDAFCLSDYLRIAVVRNNLEGIAAAGYDMVFVIDTPEVLEKLRHSRHLFVECHTPYRENRAYLSDLPDSVKAVLVPSASFRDEIRSEVPAKKDIFVLPNTLSRIFFQAGDRSRGIFLGKRPLAYMARLDDLKNIGEAVAIFESYKEREDLMFMVVGKGATDEAFIRSLRKKDLLRKTYLRSRIEFARVPDFFGMLRDHRGLFLSPSRGESFGMAVAESIASAVPVVISDIPPHRELVGSNSDFLYPQGKIREAAKKIDVLLSDWDRASLTIGGNRDRLRHRLFLGAWDEFLSVQHGERPPSLQNSFATEVLRHFRKGDGGAGSPMLSTYVSYALSTNERGEGIADLVSAYIDLRNKSYLDVGTAYGGYLVAFAGRGCHPCAGMDIDERLIGLAKLNLRENGLDPDMVVQGDICRSLPDPIRRKRFDLITCADILEHVDDLEGAMDNIRTLLSDRGCVLFEIPNPRHVRNVISDPHFGLFGLTLLPRREALEYFQALRGCAYTVHDLLELEGYLDFFPARSFRLRKLWAADVDTRECDRLFHDEIESKFEAKIGSLVLPTAIKSTLKRHVRSYVEAYRSQIRNPDVDRFHVQTWRVLVCRK